MANPFLKSQIRHWVQASHQEPQASHQLNPALQTTPAAVKCVAVGEIACAARSNFA